VATGQAPAAGRLDQITGWQVRDPTPVAAKEDDAAGVESRYAWFRLAAALALSTMGGIGMWSIVVVLPAVQEEFGAARGDATLPYTATMVAIAVGGVLMGRLADRCGTLLPVCWGIAGLAAGYLGAGLAGSLWQFTIVQALAIGLIGTSATFGPLIADVSHWFQRNRGLAIAICACGNYLAGAIWPPVLQYLIDTIGWRETYFSLSMICVATMLPLTLALRRPPPRAQPPVQAGAREAESERPLGLSPNVLQALLVLAGVACCVAMAMPQVHVVAYCADLGYGAARGAQMLSLMFGFGIVSRLAAGFIADRIGGLATLVLGSVLQMLALGLYLTFDDLASLYVISALFGLVQGGIVPSYAIVVRENFPAHETGQRLGLVLTTTLAGMALGGWLTGVIFDWSGSYRLAFVHGIAWNLLNAGIAMWLLHRSMGMASPRPALA